METFKRILAFLFGGAILGDVIAIVAARGYLPWNNSPSMGQALCDCPVVTKDTIDALIRWQLIGLLAGAIVGGIVGALLLRSRKPQPPAATP